MLEQYIAMIKQADMLSGYEIEEGTIIYEDTEVEVIHVIVPTNESGDFTIATFHKGTEALIDMNIEHKCTCHNH